jgi:hypothetical protein
MNQYQPILRSREDLSLFSPVESIAIVQKQSIASAYTPGSLSSSIARR